MFMWSEALAQEKTKNEKKFTVKRKMGLLKSCLAVMNIKRNYKMKEKILHLSPMLNLKLGKMNASNSE